MDQPSDRELVRLQSVVLGRFSIQDVIGRGGMGVVYLARDIALDRPVALKVLPIEMMSDRSRERFLTEARTAGGLSHPNIVPVYSVEDHDDLLFFVMAYVDGETLADRVERLGPLSISEASRILQDVAWALGHAHLRGVIHRDVKPDNIIIERGSGRAMVMDFGIAQAVDVERLTATGELIGTPRYMSPEQLDCEELDGRSDLYSLGLTATFALTGQAPFEGGSRDVLVSRAAGRHAPSLSLLRPELPKPLVVVIEGCLSTDRAARPASAEAVAEQLAAVRNRYRETPAELTRLGEVLDRAVVDTAGYASMMALAVVDMLEDQLFDGMIGAIVMVIALALAGFTWFDATVRVRRVLRAGYGLHEVQAALRSGGGGVPRVQRLRGLFRKLATAGGALIATVWYWYLGGDILFEDTPLMFVLGAVGFGAPFVFGRAAASIMVGGDAPLERHRRRLWGRPLGRSFLRAIGTGLSPRTGGASSAAEPTELLLADAAGNAYERLPDPFQHHLREVPGIIERLEGHASALRERAADLDRALAEAGASRDGDDGLRRRLRAYDAESELGRRRADLIRSLQGARESIGDRLAEVVVALETIRMGLLKLSAGIGTMDDLGADVEAAIEIDGQVEAVLAGRREAEEL